MILKSLLRKSGKRQSIASDMEDELLLVEKGWPAQLRVNTSRNSKFPLVPSFTLKDEDIYQTWFEFSSRPLYTLPNPPSPSRQSPRKFLVAAANSRKEKVFAAI